MDQMGSNKNEQVIKNNLISLESENVTINLHRRVDASRNTFPAFEEFSDWTNRYSLYCSDRKKNGSNSPENAKIVKKMSITTVVPRLSHIFRITSKKEPLLLSPINVKFCHKPKTNIRASFKKRQSNYWPISVSVNQSNRKSLLQVYRLKNNSIKSRQTIFQDPQANFSSLGVRKHPKTEMISSIVRVMKKRQQILSYRRNRFEKGQSSRKTKDH